MCGVLGFSGKANSIKSQSFIKSLNSLTNRGKDSMGVTIKDSQNLFYEKFLGVMNEDSIVDIKNHGNDKVFMLGHCRYGTYGEVDNNNNIQPHFYNDFFLSHNGNISEIGKYKNKLKNTSSLKGTSDSEILLHWMVENSEEIGLEKAVQQVVEEVKGAFSIIMINGENMIAFRDKWGIRPLYLGIFEEESFGIASETRALEQLGNANIREVAPGEIISINNGELKSFLVNNNEDPKFCSLEMVYLLSENSKYKEQLLSEYRRRLGVELAKELSNLKADFVIGVPNSGISAARGFAFEREIPYLEKRLSINPKYEGNRSFILPEEQRKFVAKNKFLLDGNDLKGKKIIVVDDSIIRGTISFEICKLLQEANTSEIHICSSLPPVVNICDLGIFLPTKNELLLGNNLDYSLAADKIKATSINFLSLSGLKNVIGKEICTGCLGGEYPFYF